MARTQDVKAKEKKQKIILGALGAVLLIVLAIELPGMLSSGGSPSAATTTAATTTTASGVAVAPAAGVAGSPAAVASSEVVFRTSVEKLSSLGFFKLKDPFDSHGVGGGAAAAADSSAAAAAPTPSPAAAPAKAVVKVARAAGGAGSPGPVFGTIQGAARRPAGRSIPSARIRFNGQSLTVALGQAFPKAAPYFRLAGLTPNGVIISVLKGSLADGSASLELVTKTPLTLVNTANGGRFQIELLSASKKT